MSLEDRAAAVVAKTVKMRVPRSFKADEGLISNIGFDSLHFIELSLNLEEEFDIQLTDADCETLHTFGDVTKLVFSKLHT